MPGLLASLAAALLLLAGLWWALRTPPAEPLTAAHALPELPLEEEQAELREGERRGTEAPVPVEATGGLKVRLGVRLEGAGRLEGQVLDRDSGQGVGAAQVELLAWPPAA